MQNQSHRCSWGILLPWLLTIFSGIATANPAEDSANLALPAQLSYTSALSGYQVYIDEPVQPWREANDLVGCIGGWRAYAREIRTGKSACDSGGDSVPQVENHKGAIP